MSNRTEYISRRGVYGNARLIACPFPQVIAAFPEPAPVVGAELAAAGQPAIWEQAKVGVVLTLSAVAVLLASKVLSVTSRRRSY